MENAIYVLLGNGDGTFQAPVSYGSRGYSLVAADFNRDGILDLAATSGTNTEVSVLPGNGDGTFQAPLNFDLGSVGYQVVAADMNGDGKLDLVVGTADGFSVWLGNGDGTFSLAVAVPVQESGEPTALAVADFNHDGHPDVAVTESTNYYTGSVLVFLQGPVPALSVSPTVLTFSPQAPGTNSSPQTVTLTNSGTATLTLASIGISGTDATGFAQTNNCGPTLAANASCQVKVTSIPNAAGSQTASLSITDNGPGSPQSVALTGTGQDFSLAAGSPTSVTVTPGQAANYAVTVSPVSGFSQKVALSCSGAPAQSTCTISPSSVTLNGTANATASVAVVTAGSSSRTLHPGFGSGSSRLALWLGLPGLSGLLLCVGAASHSRKRRVQWLRTLTLLGVMSLVTIWPACGGGGSSGSGTPAGTYTVTVTGTFTSGSVTFAQY